MKLRALVVDDSRVMRSMIMESLRRANLADFEFTEAVDGADGIAKFDPKTTEIVFADWNMPKMSGIEFVRSVRQAGDNAHIPIVMITSESVTGKVQRAIDEAGANAYITKPFTVAQLQEKLRVLIGVIAGSHPNTGPPGGFARRPER